MGLIFAHNTLSPRELNIEFNLIIELLHYCTPCLAVPSQSTREHCSLMFFHQPRTVTAFSDYQRYYQVFSSGTGTQFPKSTVTRLPNLSHAVSAFSCKCYAALASIRSEKSAWVTMNVSSDSQDGHFFFLTKKCSEDLQSETCNIMQTICPIVSVISWKIWLESRIISSRNLLPTALFALNMKSRLSEDGYISAYP